MIRSGVRGVERSVYTLAAWLIGLAMSIVPSIVAHPVHGPPAEPPVGLVKPVSDGGTLPATEAPFACSLTGTDDRLVEEEACHRRWLAMYLSGPHDLRALRRVGMLVDFFGGEPDLWRAAAAADAIVVGTGEAIEFSAHSARVRFKVERTLKGVVAPVVGVWMPGGPQLTTNYTDVVLAVSDAAPLLLPGDAAILLLEVDSRWGYVVQPYSGMYLRRSGLVYGPSGSGFDGPGWGEHAFLALLRTLALAGPLPAMPAIAVVPGTGESTRSRRASSRRGRPGSVADALDAGRGARQG